MLEDYSIMSIKSLRTNGSPPDQRMSVFPSQARSPRITFFHCTVVSSVFRSPVRGMSHWRQCRLQRLVIVANTLVGWLNSGPVQLPSRWRPYFTMLLAAKWTSWVFNAIPEEFGG